MIGGDTLPPVTRVLVSLPALPTDATIAPRQNQQFPSTSVSCLLDTRKDAIKNTLLLAKGIRTMTSGWQGARHLRGFGREPASNPAISSNKSWGAYRRTTLPIPVTSIRVALPLPAGY